MPNLYTFVRKVSRHLPLIIFVPVIIGLGGQVVITQPSSNAQNRAPHRTITGTVSNAITGEPIRRALVQLWAQRPIGVLTGPDGRFQIDDVPEGPVNLTAQRPGFFDSNAMPGQTRVAVPIVGSGKNDFRLTLYPAGRIVGHVNDSGGEPIENTQVQIFAEQIFQGHRQWQMRNGSTTEEDGAYRVDELFPGRYIVFATGHAEPGQSWNGPWEVHVPAYYPDAADIASAPIIEIRPGQEFRADFRLRSEHGFQVMALVGGIPRGMTPGFSLENSSGQSVYFGRTNFDPSRGQLVFQAVPSGTWTLAFSGSDTEGRQYEAREEVNVSQAEVTGLQILLHPAVSIPFIVNHAASQIANAEQPSMPQNLQNLGLNAGLISADEPFRFQQYFAQSQGDPPVWTFPNVAVGKYKLDVQLFGNECVESAWYGSVDLLRDYLVVGADATTQPITVNMRADCAKVTAKIRAGEHQEQMASLLVVPNAGLGEPRVMQIQTQPMQPSGPVVGSAGMGGISLTLSPGSYQIYALSNIDGLEYANPEALRGYPSQSVTLGPNQKMDLTLDLTERKEN
jgi:hypothetical protein